MYLNLQTVYAYVGTTDQNSNKMWYESGADILTTYYRVQSEKNVEIY